MEIVEVKPFARRVRDLFDDDQYLKFQKHLVLHPEIGKVIPGGDGLRKIRWPGSGRGKRGGVRVIYFYRVQTNRLFLLIGYLKNECEDLTKNEIKSLAGIIKRL